MDEYYERSADMRLLELEREARGGTRRILHSTSYTDPDALPDSGKDDDATYAQSGTILVATIEAQPRAGLIPGALITVSLAISNEGDTLAEGLRLSLPLPVDTAFRPGSLFLDGENAGDALAYDFFGNGADIGDLEPGKGRSVALKLAVEAGVNDVLLNPQLSATSGAILGLRAMRLKRSEPAARSAAIERPFYESEDAEVADAGIPAADFPAASQTFSVLQPTEVPPLLEATGEPEVDASPAPQSPAPVRSLVESVRSKDEPRIPSQSARQKSRDQTVTAPSEQPIMTGTPVKRESTARVSSPPARTVPAPPSVPPANTSTKRARQAKPELKLPAKPKAKAKPPASKLVTVKGGADPLAALPAAIVPVARPKIEVVRSIDDQLAIAARGGPIFMVRLDRKRLNTLTSLFAGQSFGMIAHYLMLNALAAKDPLPGDHANPSIADFVAEQEQLLSRALISTRLGKPITPESVSATLPAFAAALTIHVDERTIAMPAPGEMLLFRAFEQSEVAFLERVLANENSFPFMRAAHLFVGLCANDAAILSGAERTKLAVALSAYTALATAEISRIFLRAKLSRQPELFKATDPAFDDAARTVLAALGQSLI